MTATAADLRSAARTYREVAERHDAKGRHRLARGLRARADDCDKRADALPNTA